jgi:nucleotide-binding universal stress UspA family protein
MSSVILVPLDGSGLAERALPPAERLARTGSRRLVLIRVVELFLPAGEVCIESEHPMLDEARAYISRIAAPLIEAGLDVECAVAYGAPAQQLLAAIQVRRPDFVVMATHGRSSFGRWLHGSVADAVLCHSPTPVLLVPSHLAGRPAAGRRPRLVVPLDGSALSEAVLPAVVELAAELRAEIVLTRVVRILDSLYPEVIEFVPSADDGQLEEARTYLSGVAQRLMAGPGALPVRIRTEVGTDTGATIAWLAGDECADLIVMGTHGRSGVVRFVLGSVANGTLRQARTPLLLIRPAMLTTTAASSAAPAGKPGADEGVGPAPLVSA